MNPHSFSNLHMKAKWNKNVMLFLCFPGEPTSFITGLFVCFGDSPWRKREICGNPAESRVRTKHMTFTPRGKGLKKRANLKLKKYCGDLNILNRLFFGWKNFGMQNSSFFRAKLDFRLIFFPKTSTHFGTDDAVCYS